MDVAGFEQASKIVLGGLPVSPEVRKAAERSLTSMGESLSSIPSLQSVLDASTDSYAIKAAAGNLTRLVTEHWNTFTEEHRAQIRNYLLDVLAKKGPVLESFAVQALVQLLCRITKYAWFDDGASVNIRTIVVDATKFLEASIRHCAIGLTILNDLTMEMNYKNRNRSLTQQRKVSVSFRDICLGPIPTTTVTTTRHVNVFETALSMLHQLATRQTLSTLSSMPPQEAAALHEGLLEQSLRLLQACLNYDFIGTNPDESMEDVVTLHVPATWQRVIVTGTTLRLLFNLYKGCATGRIAMMIDAAAPPITATPGEIAAQPTGEFPVSLRRAAQTLDVLCSLMSVRRSIFPGDTERRRYLGHILRGVVDILREGQGLKDQGCFHEFSKLLARIKNNYQLVELVRTEGYSEWVKLVAVFTIGACQPGGGVGGGESHSNHLHYILSLWSKLVASVPFAKLEGVTSGPSGGGSAGLASMLMGGAGSAGAGAGNNGLGLNKAEVDELLQECVPQILASYVKGRFDSLLGEDAAETREEMEDLERMEDQLEHVPLLARYQYASVTASIMSLFDPLHVQYKEARSALRANPAAAGSLKKNLEIMESQLAWLVTVIGAIVGGATQGGGSYLAHHTMSSLSGDGIGEEGFDADLSQRVLRLMAGIDDDMNSLTRALASSSGGGRVTNQQLAAHPVVHLLRPSTCLEMSVLYFMSQFRKSYISEVSGMPAIPATTQQKASEALLASSALANAGGTGLVSGGGMGGGMNDEGGRTSTPIAELNISSKSRIFLSMFERMGLGTHQNVVSVMLGKVANTLRWRGDNEDLVKRSLDVLHDLIYSYASGRLLLTSTSSGPVHDLLAFHTPEYFPFLAMPGNERHRTTFYSALARLVFFEDDSDRFEPFVAPLLGALDALAPAVGHRNSEVMRVLGGACRDWRGIIAAAHNRSSYLQVFEALNPRHLDTFARGLETWADETQVTTPVLKLFSELLLQRGQRINFGNNSPNGILLFRAAARVVSDYCSSPFRSQPVPETHSYALLYKSVSICTQIMSRALESSFVNFAVFKLYNDPALERSSQTLLQLIFRISPDELFNYPKLTLLYMTLIQLLLRSFIDVVASLPSQYFRQILATLSRGLDSLDSEVASLASSSIDSLATYFVKNEKKDIATANAFKAQVSATPRVFHDLMLTLFRVLVFDESLPALIQTLTKPLLPAIIAAQIVHPDALEEYKNELIMTQPPEKREKMNKEFIDLARDVTKSLDVMNRDKFSNRIISFRSSIREWADISGGAPK